MRTDSKHEERLAEMRHRIEKRDRIIKRLSKGEQKNNRPTVKKRIRPRKVKIFSTEELIDACQIGTELANNPDLKDAFQQIAQWLKRRRK